MANLLAIDTSAHCCQIALTHQGQNYTAVESRATKHGSVLLSMIDQLLIAHKLTISELDGLILNSGPGSFTGLRIGASAVKAFSFAYNIPVVSVSALQLLAAKACSHYRCNRVCVAIPARQQSYYVGCYVMQDNIPVAVVRDHVTELAKMAPADNHQDWVAIGEDWPKHPFINHYYPSVTTDAECLLALGELMYHRHQRVSATEFELNYCREQVVF